VLGRFVVRAAARIGACVAWLLWGAWLSLAVPGMALAQLPEGAAEITTASRAQMVEAWRALSDDPGDIDVRLVADEDFRFVWLGAARGGPTICARDCTLHLAPGAYRFGLRVITSDRVLHEETVLVDHPGVLRGEYHSPIPWRAAAGVTLGATQLAAGVILFSTLCFDIFGTGSCPDRSREQLGALAISVVGIALAAILFVKSLHPYRIRFVSASSRSRRARRTSRSESSW